MPVSVKIIKNLDEKYCNVKGAKNVFRVLIISLLKENKEKAYTCAEMLELVKKHYEDNPQDSVGIPKIRYGKIYNLLIYMSKNPLEPITRKGSYYWYEEKEANNGSNRNQHV